MKKIVIAMVAAVAFAGTAFAADVISLPAKNWTDFSVPYRYNMKVGDIVAASRRVSSGKTDSSSRRRFHGSCSASARPRPCSGT